MIETLKDQALLLGVKLAAVTDPPVGGTGGNDPKNCAAGQVCIPSNLPDVDLATVISRVINWGLAMAGGVAVLMLIIGGFYYITAAGDEHRMERGKATIRGAITGIIIILISAIIVNTINNVLFNA
jgi:hypothetical protein